MRLKKTLTSDDPEEDYISGIHNYCDRWCERCSFTTRCRVFAMEQQSTDEERDINNEAFWRNLQNIFAEAGEMLRQMAAELEIDLNNYDAAEAAEREKRQDEKIEREDLIVLAKNYSRKVKSALDAKDEWLIFSELDETAQAEMLSVIGWYQYFIVVKIQRGLNGILDFDDEIDAEELNDSQSDANGSIKVALAAVARSRMAWAALMTRENSQIIAPLIRLLDTIEQKAEGKFPSARDFIRPGFDELETIA